MSKMYETLADYIERLQLANENVAHYLRDSDMIRYMALDICYMREEYRTASLEEKNRIYDQVVRMLTYEEKEEADAGDV